MTPRAVEEKKSNNRTEEEAFDFADTSDLCDFGYVLAPPVDSPAPAQQTNTQPSK